MTQSLPALPPGQARVYEFVADFIGTYRYPPSITQMCDALDLARSTVHFHVQALVRKGWIEVGPTTSKQLRVVR